MVCKQYSWAQSFQPKYSNLARIELKLFRLGKIQTDFILKLRKNLDGEDLLSISLPYIKIPTNNLKWILFEFDDITVIPDETYYIICTTTGGNNVADYYVVGGCKNQDLYPRGELWLKNKGNDWIEYEYSEDLCFKTYANDNDIPMPKITGPLKIKPGIEYEFNITTTFPDNQEVYYFVDWGDGTCIYWTGPFAPEEKFTVKHQWSEKNTYLISVQARNISGYASDQGTLTVTVPRCKALNLNINFLWWLKELFPNLQYLLGL